MRTVYGLILCVLFTTSCYRTHYVNFSPENPNRAGAPIGEPVRRSGWQSFWVYGWFPVELEIDARARCGNAANIESVQTRRTFLEGLVAAVAGFYINIYSPWNGAVYCKEPPG